MTLSQIECEWVQWNYAADLGQEDHREEISAWQGLKLAIADPKTWLLMGILYSCYIVGAVTNVSDYTAGRAFY